MKIEIKTTEKPGQSLINLPTRTVFRFLEDCNILNVVKNDFAIKCGAVYLLFHKIGGDNWETMHTQFVDTFKDIKIEILPVGTELTITV